MGLLQNIKPKIIKPKIPKKNPKVKKNFDRNLNFCKKPRLKFWTARNRIL